MRGLLLGVLVCAVAAAAAAAGGSATPPGAHGLVLFSQPRCPLWAGRRCVARDQPCAVDPATGAAFVPALPAADAVLSPDGRSIAWEAGTDLLVAAAGGSGQHPIAKVAGGTTRLAWSPDGTQIAAVGFTDLNPAPLVAVDVAAATSRALAPGVFDPAWSPDGGEIAGAVFDGLVAVPAAGGPERRIASESGTGNVGDQAPDWSPDSTTLAYTHRNGLQPSTVRLALRDGSAARDLTQGTGPSWSPDGSEIAFVRSPTGAEAQIWAARADGSGERPLSATPLVHDAFPRWLNGLQSAALVPAGNCDVSVDENDARAAGSEGADTFFVSGARDDVEGSGGDDLVWVSNPAAYSGGGGPERLDGGPGNDDFELYAGQSTLLGGPGDDRVDALFANLPQHVLGGAGRDWIRGGTGPDVIDGGDGNDALYGSLGANTIHGGPGNDVVAAVSSDSDQRLYGDAGNDRIVGGREPDRLDGGPGNDRIEARDGRRDLVLCGPGRDTAVVDRRDAVRGCERVLRPR